MRLIFLLLLLLAPLSAGAQGNSSKAPTAFPTTSGSGIALEGDLVSVNGAAVKLWGIDAPEAGQMCKTKQLKEYNCFIAAKNMLQSYVGSNQVICHIRGKDHNGQSIGTCGVAGLDLAALMVRSGWAMALRTLSSQYGALEGEAQARNRGLWAGPVETPWAWRARSKAEKGGNK